jgi:hypothetical protein
MKPYRGALNRLLSSLAPEPAAEPAIAPAAEVRSIEEYQAPVSWDQLFDEMIAPAVAAKNAKWEAYGRGEAVPGARPILGATFTGHDITVVVDQDAQSRK